MRSTLRKPEEPAGLTRSAKANTARSANQPPPCPFHTGQTGKRAVLTLPSKKPDWEDWEHNVASGEVFLPPSCVSLRGRAGVSLLLSAGTPRWVRRRFQRIQMCTVAHEGFSPKVLCENQSHILASVCRGFCFFVFFSFFAGETTKDSNQLGGLRVWSGCRF